MNKTIIIRQSDNDGLVIDVLHDGYNIIEKTVYGLDDMARRFLYAIEYMDKVGKI